MRFLDKKKSSQKPIKKPDSNTRKQTSSKKNKVAGKNGCDCS
jgi:hypothetical protein